MMFVCTFHWLIAVSMTFACKFHRLIERVEIPRVQLVCVLGFFIHLSSETMLAV